jgi:hypothetical protein
MKIIHKFIVVFTFIFFISCNTNSKKDNINRNLIDNKNISLVDINKDKKIIV